MWLFRLVRWKNLLMVALTQTLAYVKLHMYTPFYLDLFYFDQFSFSFYMMLLGTVFIAAAGYIINDYFDVKIDVINKPEKLIITRHISRRWALVLHLVLTITGITLGLISFWPYGETNHSLGAVFFLTSFLLWMYSVKFKAMPLLGNVIVSLMMAMTVGVVYLAEPLGEMAGDWIAFYALFAFLTGLSREIVKDIEDIEGDEELGCRTLPIIWGIPQTKRFTIFIVVLTLALVILAQFYLAYRDRWLIMLYLALFVAIPLALLILRLRQADKKKDFSALSRQLKLIMLAGVLSMLLKLS